MTLSVLLVSFLTFVQLNCENLFDCKDDSVTNDNEYLPGSPRKWTTYRYWNKLNNLSREIISCGEDSTGNILPDFVTLCEVENDSVLHDLTRRSMLRNAGYEYIVTSSSDERGIDVALLYKQFSFAPISHRSLKVKMPYGERNSRDILYVSGRIITDDTLHIFVVHSPSRYGGEKATRPLRMATAEVLCEAVDSIRRLSPNAMIIASGDFNDEANDPALKRIKKNGLINTCTTYWGKGKGPRGENGAKDTYKYRGRWQSIDHILASPSMNDKLQWVRLNDKSFLLTEDTKYGGVKPRRTYVGYRYDNEGYSDHLPLIARFGITTTLSNNTSSTTSTQQDKSESKSIVSSLTPVALGYSKTSVNTTVFRNNSVVTDGDTQYICFYDTLGYVTLGKRNVSSKEWALHRTQYKGNVKDAHNVISMMVDGDGYLHLSFDHHGHPLRYCRSIAPHSLELSDRESMTGIDENNVTYPEFYRLSNGDLLFAYRSGSSGRGNLVLNRYSTKTRTWHRVQDILIDGENKRNAYWQLYVDARDIIHLSWVWRETWHVETNHDLCYAQSTDGGKTWKKSNGEQYTLPIRHDNAEYAWRIPQNSELINQTSMSADEDGNPYIATYWRDSTSTIPQYRLVWHDGNRWHSSQVGNRTTPFSLKGGGTKMIPIARPRLVVHEGRAAYIFRDEERGSRVTMAYTDNLISGQWQFTDLTTFPVDAWEPSYDTELWKTQRRLDIFVQHTKQGDGERTSNNAPTPVYVLEVDGISPKEQR